MSLVCLFPGQLLSVISPLVARGHHGVFFGAVVWFEQPGEVEEGGVIHEGVQPWHLDHPRPHVVLGPDVKLLPEVDLVEPALLSSHRLSLPHAVRLDQIQQVEKFLLV